MGRIIEAKAVISAEDRTGKTFDAIASKFREVGKGAKASVEVGRLAKQIDAANAGIKNIERFRSAQASFGAARTNFRATQLEVGRIAKELDAARKAATAFDGIRSFSKTGAIAGEMAAAKKQVGELERQFTTAQRAAKAASAGFEAQAAALKGAKHGYEGGGGSVGNLVADQARLKAAIEGTNAQILRQEALIRAESRLTSGMGEHGRREAARIAQDRYLTDGMSAPARRARARADAATADLRELHEAETIERRRHMRRHGAVQAATIGAAGYVSAHSVGHGIGDTLKAGARYQHEVVALQNAGRTPEEMREIEHASHEAIKAVPTATFSENLKVINETTGAFGSLHHAIENLPFMQKSAAVLHASAGDKIQDDAGALGNKLARFFEMRGTAGNTEVFQKEAAEMVRAMVFTRGNFNPHEMVNFAQQAKSSLPLYSERFMSKIVPSLVTEYGGERAGTGANAFRNVIMGKANDKKQAEEWVKLGLLDTNMAIMKGGHAVSWKAGAVKDTNTALSDPLEWAEKTLIPALQKNGVDVEDKLELSKALGTLFRNSNSNMFAEALSQRLSRNRLHKDEDNMTKSATVDEAYKRNLSSDATEGVKALKASMESLMEATSGPAMETAAAGMTKLAGGISALALSAKDHPIAAMAGGGIAGAGALAGAGYLSYKLLTGFGLPASATALTASAAELSAAAAVLSGKGAVSGALGNGTTAAAGAGLATSLGLLGTTITTAIAAGFAVKATAATMPKVASEQGAKGIDYATGGTIETSPMDGLAPDKPWLSDWWRDHAPSWLGGGDLPQPALAPNSPSAKRGREFGALKRVPLPPRRPDSLDGRAEVTLPEQSVSAAPVDAGEVQQATAALAAHKAELASVQAQLNGLRASGEAAFSAETSGLEARIADLRKVIDDASGQRAAINNTLDKAANASATAANGGRPIEATVKPDQITAKIDSLPPVSGEATVSVDNRVNVTVTVNEAMLNAKVEAAAGRAAARIPLSSGARPGAVSMPGAAATPGARGPSGGP